MHHKALQLQALDSRTYSLEPRTIPSEDIQTHLHPPGTDKASTQSPKFLDTLQEKFLILLPCKSEGSFKVILILGPKVLSG